MAALLAAFIPALAHADSRHLYILGLSVCRDNDVVGEYLWDVQQGGEERVSFSFAGVVGEELSFSSFMLTRASLENASFAASSSPYTLVEQVQC